MYTYFPVSDYWQKTFYFLKKCCSLLLALKLLHSKVKKTFPVYNYIFVIFFFLIFFFGKNSLTELPRIPGRIQIRSQNKQGVITYKVGVLGLSLWNRCFDRGSPKIPRSWPLSTSFFFFKEGVRALAVHPRSAVFHQFFLENGSN